MKKWVKGLFILSLGLLTACKATVSTSATSSGGALSTSSSTRFASGTKAVKIITSNTSLTGSFSSFISSSTAIPVSTPVPIGYPGYTGSATYLPGVAATQFFDMDGTTVITKPSWLTDIQVGVTSNAASSACATFGGAGQYDASGFYRVSEKDCGAVATGTGGNSDKAFIRIVLNRSTSVLGSGENLLVQIEYQASGIRPNSDGVSTNPENNVDQLWKVFWNSSLASTATANPFSVFVPPQFGTCLSGGSEATGAPGACPAASGNAYNGAPITVKQIMIPLSAYPTLSVIQISRVKGRINNASTFPDASNVNYVSSFCGVSDSPLCLGLVVRSITLLRI